MNTFRGHRAGCLYRFVPVLMDRGVNATPGSILRFVPATGMGVSGRLPSRFAYAEHLGGELVGMVCSNSLVPLTKEQRKIVRHVTTPTRHRAASTHFVIESAEETL